MSYLNFIPPSNIVNIQRRIQQVFPTRKVIVAGGAMRDAYMRRTHKDVDVFVESRRDLGGFPNTLEILTRGLKQKPTAQMGNAEYLPWQREVTGYANYNLLDEDVQIVGLDYRPLTTMMSINRMDVGLCQIGWDGVRTECTLAFLRDVENSTLTVTRCNQPTDVIRTRARIARFQETKYADFEAVWEPSVLPDPENKFLSEWKDMTEEELKLEQEKWNQLGQAEEFVSNA